MSSSKPFTEKFGFYNGIKKVIKQVRPDLGIASDALGMINSLTHQIASDIAVESSNLCKSTDRKTLTSREIQAAVRLILPGELSKHAVSEGAKAVTHVAGGMKYIKGAPRQNSANLQFSVANAEHIIRNGFCARMGDGAPYYLAAVVEYLCAEIIELSGNVTRDDKRQRITVDDLVVAITEDEELAKLYKDICLIKTNRARHTKTVADRKKYLRKIKKEAKEGYDQEEEY